MATVEPLNPESPTFYTDFYKRFSKAMAERDLDSFFVLEHTAMTKVQTVYQRLGATTNFLEYLEKKASQEVNGVSLSEVNSIYFSTGGSAGGF